MSGARDAHARPEPPGFIDPANAASTPGMNARSHTAPAPLLAAALVLFGAAWGLGQPLNKIVVSGGYRPWGIIFWQSGVALILLMIINTARGRGLPRGAAQWRVCAMVATLGTLLPHWATYSAVAHLPAGVMALIMAAIPIPILSLPIAVGLGQDAFTRRRAAGLLAGFAGAGCLIAARSGLGGESPLWFVALGAVAPLCYALNGNLLTRFGRAGMDPIQLFLGTMLLVLPAAGGLALATGQFIAPRWPLSPPDLALLAVAAIHACVYTGFLWLLAQAGAVFAAQVAYLVTGFGMVWSVLILHESYPGWVWLAFLAMLLGIFLVQPRPNATLAQSQSAAKDKR
ncbi:DMT family transporter [Actibacterium ureilyticum]|uniref:DMT family transporter n=1 Tax=Actibacterium ureilyticum TaxID=1590614 RepID=UPI000BAB11DC|nr:DMT family transporter [Actibacterium ureilyticum]